MENYDDDDDDDSDDDDNIEEEDENPHGFISDGMIGKYRKTKS